MAEINISMLEQLEKCGQAAGQLTKTINQFDIAGNKLARSISELNTFDKMLKEDDSVKTLIKSSAEIKKMLDYFEKNLPTFKEVVDQSRKELIKYKGSLDDSMKLSEGMMKEIDGLATLVDSIKGIKELLNSFRETELSLEIKTFQLALDEFTAQTKKTSSELSANLLEGRGTLEELKLILEDHAEKVMESTKSQLQLEVIITNSFKTITADVNNKVDMAMTQIEASILSLQNKIDEATINRRIEQKQLIDTIKLHIEEQQKQALSALVDFVDEKIDSYTNKSLPKEFAGIVSIKKIINSEVDFPFRIKKQTWPEGVYYEVIGTDEENDEDYLYHLHKLGVVSELRKGLIDDNPIWVLLTED